MTLKGVWLEAKELTYENHTAASTTIVMVFNLSSIRRQSRHIYSIEVCSAA
jgi:hypothetical protein